MLVDFFLHLKSFGLPVSTRRVADAARGARCARRVRLHRRLPFARANLPRQGRAAFRPLRPRLRRVFQGRRGDPRCPCANPRGMVAPGNHPPVVGGRPAGDRGTGRTRQADGDVQAAPGRAARAASGRQQVDRHRRDESVRRLRLQPRGPAHRAGGGWLPLRSQGLGPAGVPQSRRRRRAQHPQHQGCAAPAAAVRPRGRSRGARPRRHDRGHRAQCRLARSEAAARAAQPRQGPAVPRRRRVDGSARRSLRGALFRGPIGVPPPRALLFPQLHLRPRLARQPAPPRRASRHARPAAHLRPRLEGDHRRRCRDEPLRA